MDTTSVTIYDEQTAYKCTITYKQELENSFALFSCPINFHFLPSYITLPIPTSLEIHKVGIGN